MPEQIPYGVAASLINRLASAAFREFGRIYGVMDELERLKSTVESIKAVLVDAEDKQEQSHAVQIWIKRLKDDVLHPADNLLDEFVIQDMKHKMDETTKNKVTKVLVSLSPNKVSFRRKMAHEIEKIQKKLNDVVKDMSGLNLNQNVVVVQKTSSVRRETSSFVLESDIIGRENDKNEVINLLRQPHGNNNVSTVAIVGIGGLGKTALAQLVYNDSEVKEIFEKIMWVCVSENFVVKTIVQNMLESLTQSKIDGTLPLDNLQNMVHDKLFGKRYLLVLDDIWNENFEKWGQLRSYLMCGAQGSKILVTTRSKTVAQTMSVSDPYVLNGLSQEESWDLLKKIAFGDGTIEVNRSFESIGKKIAKKCSGVPLAIRTLGGLLQGNREEKEWIDILQGAFWKLCEDEESIMPVLKLSYQNLSPQLRQCFAYCSLYPKDWEIENDELIQLWMAQGYLECSDENQSIEDIGNQFVKILLMKSFFQDAQLDNDNSDIVSFKMHDLIHDLAMQVGSNDCCYLDSETKRVVGCPMHIMLKSDAFGLLESLDANRMQTLILLTTKELNEKELTVISKFKYLRVLKLSGCSLGKLSDSIGKLKHLRYLQLFECKGLGSLSKSISNLVCLQTLILDDFEEVEFSTKDISKLINMRHFCIANLKASEPKKTTSRFGKLNVGRQYNCVIFSNWFSPLTNIVQISLDGCDGLKHLPPMERLPFLKSLSIHTLNELEFIYYEEPLLSESFFPSLEKLKFFGCPELRGWRRMRDDVHDDDTSVTSSQSYHLSFPRLSELTIYGCCKLTYMPTFPKLDQRLILTYSKLEVLEATLNMVGSKCSIEFPPLSMLKYLSIGGYDLNVEKLPKDWVLNLTSLKELVFCNLPDRTFQKIGIWFNDNLNYLPFLESITFSSVKGLKGLPDWVCNLSSLHRITFLDCKVLASLPEGLPRLAKLQTLKIVDCPDLIEEYKMQTSETWHKIAHIPNIILKISSY
ncbi:disease resistance protein RGA2-like isoform X2 [Trifolium pratense]|uniref:disease resistance protein RGA2-like isoform X2 n=1 Tax=Trifolium pratense TaxID=57577 RepID=UPI001E694591|nr:disease resistance protein RGA2-like isoform X2 [Trifolium pratense]